MYGFIDKSDFETMLSTWSITEIPPSPKRNAVKIMFIDICFIFIEAIWLIPFVISKNPVKSALEILGEISNKLLIGSNITEITFVIPDVFKIDTITENKTINPPIIRIVEVEDFMLSPKISPKFLKLTFCNLVSNFDVWYVISVGADFFQNLNIMPTVKHAEICVKKSKKPIIELPNKDMPQVPIINNGPELFVKLSNLSHSSLVQVFVFLKFTAIFAPTGYPLKVPIINAKELSPETLNRGLIILLNILPKNLGTFV